MEMPPLISDICCHGNKMERCACNVMYVLTWECHLVSVVLDQTPLVVSPQEAGLEEVPERQTLWEGL